MQFLSQSTSNGVIERSFSVGDVPGVLWTPEVPSDPAPLVLMGHPGGLHKMVPGVVARATHLVTALGFSVASIDAPGHGGRERSASDAEWVERIRLARRAGRPLGPIVSTFNGELAERAAPEWRTVLDELQTLPEIDAESAVGYSGMTIATEIGFRLLQAEPRIGAAVLGSAFASDELLQIARDIRIPVLYLLAWDDPEIDREEGLRLYGALGSEEKSLHANPGTHKRVPGFESDDTERFFARHLLTPRARTRE
jgi:hypothetical protein